MEKLINSDFNNVGLNSNVIPDLEQVMTNNFDIASKENIENILSDIDQDFLVNNSYDPNILEQFIRDSLGDNIGVNVIGDITRRRIVFQDLDHNLLALKIFHDGSYVQTYVDKKEIESVGNNNIYMVSLYHKENFPLPRFALGIGIIAGVVRKNNLGKVVLKDMQLGEEIDNMMTEIEAQKPNIISLSATFGQQDLLYDFLSKLNNLSYSPKILVGGSLGALNYKYIIEEFPNVVVGLGEGEQTMLDFIQCDDLKQINNIAYNKDGSYYKTTSKKNAINNSIPELDLLGGVLENGGVMNFEACRGCTNACSFCPRNHKGKWREIEKIDAILPYVDKVFEKHNGKRVLYFVDEEFIGQGSDNLERVETIAKTLGDYGFKFETNTRINQVYKENKTEQRYLERVNFWRKIKKLGLNKVLFGVESGVDSILKRFNKQTTREENISGIRLASMCGASFRATYITYDPLMNMDELIESYKFQGRDDLILKSVGDDFSDKDILKGIYNDDFVDDNKKGIPLYKEISYMLVSLECFKDSKYSDMAQECGILEEENLSLGKNNVKYLDERIGYISHNSQLWIDRWFPLDYTLKSLLKTSKNGEYKTILGIRELLKDYSYNLLGQFLYIINGNESIIFDKYVKTDLGFLQELRKELDLGISLDAVLKKLLDKQYSVVGNNIIQKISDSKENINSESYCLLENIVKNQLSKSGWKLIN